MTAEHNLYLHKVTEALSSLRKHIAIEPEILVSLGTGLVELPDGFQTVQTIPYTDIPHFPRPTVVSHPGTLVIGTLSGRKVAVLQGRVHYYEGYTTQEVAFPVRCLSLLGCTTFIAVNAAGGLNPALTAGDFMIATDHINFIPDNPLRGLNQDNWGPRFPDMSQAYSSRLSEMALRCAEELGLSCSRGVYVSISGPSLETPAETRFLRMCGADAVGMSTVPEVIVAKHADMEILVFSIIANVNNPDNFQPILLDEVIKQVKISEQQFLKLLSAVVEVL